MLFASLHYTRAKLRRTVFALDNAKSGLQDSPARGRTMQARLRMGIFHWKGKDNAAGEARRENRAVYWNYRGNTNE